MGGAGVALFWLLRRRNGAGAGVGCGDREPSPAARSVAGAEARLTLPQAPVCQPTALRLFCAEGWQSGALRLGRGGARCPHFWTPGLRAWPWLKGGGVSL